MINSQPAWMSGDGVGRLLANALNWAAKTRSNSAPTANSKTVTTDEDTAVVITLGASDAEGDSLTYTVGSPAHGTLTGTAPNLTYTPAENYNGPDSFTFKVNDGSLDSNVATVTINVVAVNDPPQLSGVPLSATIPELSPYTFTAAATDVDSPANSLAFSLSSSAPAGATINPTTGAFSWTPTEAQGPGNYSFNVIVTDNQGATGSQSINLSVTEVNQAPALDPIGPRAVDELTPLSFTAHAADGDNPSNRLTYSLENGATGAVPSGASINPATGAFSWTPTEAQGPNTYKFTVKVTDNGAGNLSAREEIIVTVNEVNAAPTLAAVGNKTVDEQTALSFNAVGGDTDDPANTLTYSLADGTTAESGVSLAVPAGASINPTTGAFSWTPAEAQGPGKYRFIVKVTDNGTPSRSGQEEITVTVNEVNTAPALNAIPGPKTVDEETPLTFTARATDADLPANTLAYSLIPAAAGGTLPDGAAIDATTGVFTWTPTEAQGPGSYSFKVKVSDGTGQTGLTDEKLVTVNVNEVNKRPALPAIGNATPFWGQSVAFTPTATDGDLPANTLSYALTSSNQGGVPGNVSFNAATGAFSWTPTALQAGATYNFTITVNDNTGANNATDSKSFSVTVGKHPTTLTYGGALAGQYSDPAALSATLLDTVTNTAVAGAPITFQLGTQNAGAPSGLGTTLILTQDPAPSYNVVSSFAGDGAYVASGDTDAFDITQEDARAYYTGALYAATSSTSSGSATVTLAATIRDITAETADPAFDANAGDIRNATVKFVNRDANNAVLCTAGIGLVNLSDTKVGTVTCDWAANIGSAESDQFTVGIVVSGFYRRDASTENTVVTVSKPIAGLVTGGGYLVLSSPGGQRAGDVGSKSNFGFNIRNDPKTGPKGKINAIVRRRESDGIVHVYQIKGNAMSSLAQDLSKTTNHPYPTAVFNGKANIQDITNPLAPISIDGGASLQVVMTDKGEPGSADMIAITLWDKAGGLWFSSNWNGTKTSEQVLGGGNLQIR